MPEQENDRLAGVKRGVRLDLIVAICALLISTLAAGASWWQARVVQAQTQVLTEQLGAQVWPYVSVSETITGDTAQISIVNEGLGPAILRNEVALVDGVPKSGFVEILHAILGPNILARTPRSEKKMSIGFNTGSPGAVLRPAASIVSFTITSKRYARPFILGATRLSFRICYCAIIPGRCWLSDSAATRDPQPVTACREIPNDLLHASPLKQLFRESF